MEDELKPCPFCGGKAFFYKRHDGQMYKYWNTVECVDCEASIAEDGIHFYTDPKIEGEQEEIEKELLEKWNRRIQ